MKYNLHYVPFLLVSEVVVAQPRVLQASVQHFQSKEAGPWQPLMAMAFGNPPQEITGIFDSGSGDTVIPQARSRLCKSPNQQCAEPAAIVRGQFDRNQSSDVKDVTGERFNASFSGGDVFLGDYIKTTVTVAGGSVPDAQVALANEGGTTDDFPVFAIYGFGPSASVQTNKTYENLPQAMKSAGVTKGNSYSVVLNSTPFANGSVFIGGIDRSKFTGELQKVDIVKNIDRGVIDDFFATMSSISLDMSGGDGTQNAKREEQPARRTFGRFSGHRRAARVTKEAKGTHGNDQAIDRRNDPIGDGNGDGDIGDFDTGNFNDIGNGNNNENGNNGGSGGNNVDGNRSGDRDSSNNSGSNDSGSNGNGNGIDNGSDGNGVDGNKGQINDQKDSGNDGNGIENDGKDNNKDGNGNDGSANGNLGKSNGNRNGDRNNGNGKDNQNSNSNVVSGNGNEVGGEVDGNKGDGNNRNTGNNRNNGNNGTNGKNKNKNNGNDNDNGNGNGNGNNTNKGNGNENTKNKNKKKNKNKNKNQNGNKGNNGNTGNTGNTGSNGNNGNLINLGLKKKEGLTLFDTGGIDLTLPAGVVKSMAKALDTEFSEEDGLGPVECDKLSAGNKLVMGFNNDSVKTTLGLDKLRLSEELTNPAIKNDGLCQVGVNVIRKPPKPKDGEEPEETFNIMGFVYYTDVYTVFDLESNSLWFAQAEGDPSAPGGQLEEFP
ncbi:hypothetical protein V2A60_010247 [Cordyceps javanica]|uniref:Candidapepsin-4 n=1 Tax=Cordyceps javanica TaxID=43265 RepID=A0A545UV34_9HYPO|nr:candidapepsin-4 precursor [Cordyceps javanica]TQW05321.1 candidapepsin-4 precursor [Cordyceps javanica]